MRTLAIDIETYSSAELADTGVYRYTEAPDFSILLFAYAIDDMPVELIDLANSEELPDLVYKALTDPTILKTAYNANFERTCIAKHFNIKCDPAQWECSMVKAMVMGLPASLDMASKALGVVEKDDRGKALISYFCKPCKPTKTNGGRTRNLPSDAHEKWEAFKSYCVQDVVVERNVRHALSSFVIPAKEKHLWNIDQRMNDNGVLIDKDFVNSAIECAEKDTEYLTAKAKELTQLDNPNSLTQIKKWLADKGVEVDSLSKEVLPEMIESAEDPQVKELLELRAKMGKTSVKKYQAMQDAVCKDGRVRGLLQFYGANRTGRYSGRLVQLQNLPRNYLKDLDLARELVKDGRFEDVDMFFGNTQDTLSQLIRTAFIAPEGKTLAVSDFSAIEARVIAWLAQEKWRLNVFNTHGKIYEASASQMFKVPIEEIDKGSPLRQKGKIAELALGYGGGVGALTAMGALNMGLEEKELKPLVTAWRKANPKIVEFWSDVGSAAIDTVLEGKHDTLPFGLKMRIKDKWLFITLPSGRALAYMNPNLKENKFSATVLTYSGVNQTTKKWEEVETYGPKLVENIVQAVARDCLAEAIIRLDALGYKTIFHVHDEVVIEVPKDTDIKEINNLVGDLLPWAPGLPLRADGYLTDYYMKD